MERLSQEVNRKEAFPQRSDHQIEKDMLEKIKKDLEEEIPIRELDLSRDESGLIQDYQLLDLDSFFSAGEVEVES